jgi:hypothetical protein
MTHPDDRIRESLRDLIPSYQGPADPAARVSAVIRRRRSRQRVLIAISSMAAVAAILFTVPLATRGRGAGPAGLAGSAPPAGSPAARGSAPVPVGPGRLVASGSVAAGRWTVRAVQLTSGARRCLQADDAVFQAAALCFDDWPPGGQVSWGTVDAVRSGVPVTAVFGVAATTIGSVVVVLSDGRQRKVQAVANPDHPDTRFFALVAPAPQLTVQTVTTYTTDDMLAQFPTAASGSPACRPSADEPCARRTG